MGTSKEMQPLASSDDEESTGLSSEEECPECGATVNGDAKFCHKCGAELQQKRCSPGRLGGCLCCCFIVLGLLITLLLVFLNHVVSASVQTVGTALLGVPVTVGAVDINLWSCKVGLERLDVGSPEGFEDKLLQLGSFTFDMDPGSLWTAWRSGFTKPIVLESFEIIDLNATIDMKEFPFGDSNAQAVVEHLNEITEVAKDQVTQAHHATGGFLPSVHDLTAPPPKPTIDQGIQVAMAKVRTDKIHFSNITAGVRISTLPKITYTMEQILLKDVGKNETDGVYVYELVDILVRAVLMSLIRGAPTSIQSNLAKGFGTGLWREMDFASLHMDMGQGLENVVNLGPWLTEQSALLNVRMASQGAKLATQAAELGAEMNLEAMKSGAKLTGLGMEAQMAATNAQVNAGIEGAQLASRISTGFTNGLTSILR